MFGSFTEPFNYLACLDLHYTLIQDKTTPSTTDCNIIQFL